MNNLYLKAVRGESLKISPVWMMRQAGRYLPEYLDVRKKHEFLEVCSIPELACEVTLQPIRRFKFDAAILFSDILVPLVPMGINLSFGKGHGPQIANPVRSTRDIQNLKNFEPREELGFVLDAIRMIRAELPTDVALIGFTGAPFTLATYLIEGGKPNPFANTKRLMYTEPEAFASLLNFLGTIMADYLHAMVEAGADAVQVFDTWAGILPEREFRNVNLPVLQQIFQHLNSLKIPSTYFALGSSHLLNSIKETGCSVIGLDWRLPIPETRKIIGNDVAVQGNLDPTVLLADEATIRRETRQIVVAGREKGGHIFNLGHGILPMTPISSVEIMLDEIRKA